MANSLRFQSFTLDLQRLCLRGPAGEVDLRPKSFEVLRYLAEHAGRVVPKEEVIKAVWPDVTVTDESLTRCISEVRRAIGDDAQEIIKTVSRRGYLFELTRFGRWPRRSPRRGRAAVLSAARQSSTAFHQSTVDSGTPVCQHER